MISVFIFRSNARGMQYGMGTYIRELVEALASNTNIKIYIVTYHRSQIREFIIESKSERCYEINIPSPKLNNTLNNKFENSYAKAVVNLIGDIIAKSEEIVFLINYISDIQILKVIKERYTHPVITIAHFFQWEQLFNGDIQKLNGLNIDSPSDNTEFTLFTEKELFQLSDHVVAINPFMKDFLIERYNVSIDKVSLIRNGINATKFLRIAENHRKRLKQKLGFYSDEKIILFSGRIDPDKGIYFILNAFIEACKVKDNIRLVFVGQGDIQAILGKCESYIGKITFTGYLSFDKLLEFYQIADMGVVPSIYEPCSYSRLEMIASGIPLILSKIEGFSDMVEGDQCLFIDRYISPEGTILFDTKEFCKAIISLADDVKLAETFAANAFNNLISKNSASLMAEEMSKLFASLINSKKLDFEKI